MPLNTQAITALIKVPDLGKKAKNLKSDFRAYIRGVQNEISEMGKEVLRSAVITTGAVATGRLLKSVSSVIVANKSIDGFTREFGFKKPASDYAFFANAGRESGGVPPYEEIARWARAKGIDNSAINKIRFNIADYGTEGHEFMELAAPAIQRKTREILQTRTEQYKKNIK